MDFIAKEVYKQLENIQEQVRTTCNEFRGTVTFKQAYLEAHAVLTQVFRGAENRSYSEELCLILIAWQIAAGIFPTIEVPLLVLSDSPNKPPSFTYEKEIQND